MLEGLSRLGTAAVVTFIKAKAQELLVNVPPEAVDSLLATNPRSLVASVGPSWDRDISLASGVLKAHWHSFEDVVLSPPRVLVRIAELRPDIAAKLDTPDGRKWLAGLCQAAYDRVYNVVYPK